MNKIACRAVVAMNCGFAFTLSPLSFAAEAGASGGAIEEIIIRAIREDRDSRGATGLDLSPFETPQSLTILDAQTIADFRLVDINSMLSMTTGVNVDATETDRTVFNARGFDITSMHVDGIGIPFGGTFVGALDTAVYEKVEVLRGSNGLITGLGNPSGTVNYVRKRPGNEFSADTTLMLGRWDNRRVVADVSTPLTDSGSWAARFVGVYQDNDSWLDLYGNQRTVGSLVVDGQLTDTLTLAAGYTRQDNDSDGVLWGAVPMMYSNGEQTDFDISTTTSMDWTYWNTMTESAFVEIGWQATDNISVTSMLQQTAYAENSAIFYTYWNTGLDPDTGLGLFGYPGKYDGTEDTLIWDTVVSGSFSALGREHQFNVGVNLADNDESTLDSVALTGFDEMPAYPGWQGNEVPWPTWDSPFEAVMGEMSLNRIYGSLLLSMTDELNLILGMSQVDYESEGESWGVSTDSSEDGGSPYVGFTWEVVNGLNLYGSYSDIYQPQYYLDEDQQPLGSAEGKSLEFGLKKQFSSGLLASLSLFRTEQRNLQEFVRYSDGDDIDDDDFSDDFTFAEYRGINVEADGIELELAGNVTDTLRVQAGYTHLKLEDENGDEARTFIPRNAFKLLANWAPAWQPKLDLGLSARWQDEIYFASAFGDIEQDSYAVVGGFARYAFTESMSVALNIENIADEKYLSSVKYEQSYYAQPLNYNLSFNWRY